MGRTTPSHEAEKLAIAVALKDLERALGLFVRALSHESAPVSAEAAGSEREARRLVCEAYATISYAPDDQVNESPVCLGVIGGSAAVIGRAEAVNAAKDELRERCKKIQNVRVSVPVKDGKGGQVVKMLPLVRVILRELQHSDLNLLAAYRKIPILSGRVARVAYVRARTRSVYRKTRAEIAALLDGLDRPGVAEDRARLQRLTERETHLALVKERYTNVRANVWFHGLDARNRGRVKVGAELPLLYPLGRSKEIPEIKYPEAEEGDATRNAAPHRQARGQAVPRDTPRLPLSSEPRSVAVAEVWPRGSNAHSAGSLRTLNQSRVRSQIAKAAASATEQPTTNITSSLGRVVPAAVSAARNL